MKSAVKRLLTAGFMALSLLAVTALEMPVITKNTVQVDTETAYAIDSPSAQSSVDLARNLTDKPYYIKVNRQANCITVYTLDPSTMTYTIPVRAMACSTGLNGATPLGTFKTSSKYTWKELFGKCYGQYCTRISTHILFHSVPYSVNGDKSSLKTSYYNKLGNAASAGCIRLACEDAKWIYDNCPAGTTVEIYDSADPGPLGKPTSIVIDTASPNAGWDPTDPDPSNPWNGGASTEGTAATQTTESIDSLNLSNPDVLMQLYCQAAMGM